jgi:hypothetical protein
MYHFLYLIQTAEDLYTNIYKIGKTEQLPEDRFKGYNKGSYPWRISLVDNCSKRETELKGIFNNKFKLSRGREYFEGDIEEMIFEFCNFCNQKEIIKNTIKIFDIMKTNEIIQYCNSRKIEKMKKENINNLNRYENIYLNENENKINIQIKENNEFKCQICLSKFTQKIGLQKHLNKKNKCNIITDFKCKKCNKYFKYNKNLLDHSNKNICIEKIIIHNKTEALNNNNQNILDIIKEIINSKKFNMDFKIDLLKDYNIKISIDKLKKVIDSDLTNDSISKYILSHII